MAPKYAKLSALKLGIAAAITISVLSLGVNLFLMIKTFQFSNNVLTKVAINFLYNFGSGFFTGYVFAWIYNKLIQ